MSHKSDVPSENCYSVDEVSDFFDKIDAETWTQMFDIAETRSRGYGYDAKELAQEAIIKIISTDRKWPKTVEILPFFSMVCKSILSNYAKKKEKKNLSLDYINQYGDSFLNMFSDKVSDPELDLILAEVRKHIFSLFDDDQTAQELIEGRMNDYTKGNLLNLLDISDKEYESKWRKIKRRIQNGFQGGTYE